MSRVFSTVKVDSENFPTIAKEFVESCDGEVLHIYEPFDDEGVSVLEASFPDKNKREFFKFLLKRHVDYVVAYNNILNFEEDC